MSSQDYAAVIPTYSNTAINYPNYQYPSANSLNPLAYNYPYNNAQTYQFIQGGISPVGKF